MQMTMTLDEDLAAALQQEMESRGRSLEETVRHVLRRGLRVTSQKRSPASPLVIADPEVLSGNWTWRADESGDLAFRARES